MNSELLENPWVVSVIVQISTLLLQFAKHYYSQRRKKNKKCKSSCCFNCFNFESEEQAENNMSPQSKKPNPLSVVIPSTPCSTTQKTPSSTQTQKTPRNPATL